MFTRVAGLSLVAWVVNYKVENGVKGGEAR